MRAPDSSHRSDRVALRHGPLAAYRCFLPDLAGFTGLPCARPDHRHGVNRPAPTALARRATLEATPQGGFDTPGDSGGEAGIRTRGGVSPTHALQACSFSRSDTSPHIRGPSVLRRFREPSPSKALARRDKAPEAARPGGEGGIRTHVGVAPQPAFEAGPLRPLRYLSAAQQSQRYTHPSSTNTRRLGLAVSVCPLVGCLLSAGYSGVFG